MCGLLDFDTQYRLSDALLDEYKSGQRASPLLGSVYEGNVVATEFFISRLGGSFLTDCVMHELLFAAAAATPFPEKVCRVLLKHMSVTLRDDYESNRRPSPLCHAVIKGRVEAVSFLALNLGLILSDDLVHTLLWEAAIATPFHKEVCHVLLQHHMSATLLDDYQSLKYQSPLCHAVAMGRAEAVAFFANHFGYDLLVIHDKLLYKLLLVAARARDSF